MIKELKFMTFVTSLFFSCSETKEITLEMFDHNYYPINVGEYRIYDVEEINYLITGFDTTVYQIRETIEDSIVSKDRITYLLKQERRGNGMDIWKRDATWAVTKTSGYLSISESNVSFIKLVFPIRVGKQWDGNGLNNQDSDIYYYQPVESSMIDSINANDLIRVIIEDIEENVTGIDIKSEVYAKNIGLIEKNYFTQKKCTESACGNDPNKIIGGRSLKKILINVEKNE